MENRKYEKGLETPLWWLRFSSLSIKSQKESSHECIFTRDSRVVHVWFTNWSRGDKSLVILCSLPPEKFLSRFSRHELLQNKLGHVFAIYFLQCHSQLGNHLRSGKSAAGSPHTQQSKSFLLGTHAEATELHEVLVSHTQEGSKLRPLFAV